MQEYDFSYDRLMEDALAFLNGGPIKQEKLCDAENGEKLKLVSIKNEHRVGCRQFKNSQP